MSTLFRSPDDARTLRIVPMGGCGEFGMNITAYFYGGKLFIVDAGLRFTDPAKLGTDAVIPAVDQWFEAAGGVTAYLMTHGHEDHIGALGHIVPRWPAPIYATPWTASLLRNKWAKLGLDEKDHPVTVVQGGDRVRTAGFDAEYVRVNHSIPDACALFIRTPAANVFHTGDFKFDATPVIEPKMDDAKLAAIGKEGVDLLLADSTNADRSGMCPSESSVLAPLEKVFNTCKGAIVLTTFASNLWRLKTIVDVCIATGRKIFVTGPGIEQTFGIARELGLYRMPETLTVSEDKIGDFPRDRLVVLATGCQGEFRSAMNRIAYGEHRAFKIKDGDTVILSSRIIPGNERAIIAMLDQLRKQGARIVTARDEAGIHVSGHAYGGDLERLFGHLKPQQYTPIHGAFSQLAANADGWSKGYDPERALLIENGDILDVVKGSVTKKDRIDIALEYIDSDANMPIAHEVLRERLRIGELGCAVVSGVFSSAQETWLSPPKIDLQGIRLPRKVDAEEWLKRQAAAVRDVATEHFDRKSPASLDTIREEARIALRRALQAVLKKKPVVLVHLHFV